MAASVVVLAICDWAHPGAAPGSNFMLLFGKLITARLAFGGIAAGSAASAVVVFT